MEFKGEKYRITVLTDRLIRLEYSEDGRFEDRKSFAVVDRSFADEKIDMKVEEGDDSLMLETEYLSLSYDKKECTSCGLSIFLKSMGTTWHYGDSYGDFSNWRYCEDSRRC